jgi:hypothetical protein
MRNPTDDEIAGRLIGIISDGFNRSLGALVDAGAVDTRRMRSAYRGIGDRYYDLVTEQIVLTARFGAASIRQLFQESEPAQEGG